VSVADQIGSAAGLLGVLLALVTLFTSAQSSAFSAQRSRQGGPQKPVLARIAVVCLALFVVTLLSFLSLAPLGKEVWHARGTQEWLPFYAVFLWVWLLLLFLGGWQLVLAFLAVKRWLSK
jgi:hypothetical protein